jgi:glyoxylase-like metal-dependent hydrolase (beta-lactamase superfamily II)
MKVQTLQNNPLVYSCKVYFVRGNWNAISDINTLIDVGTDDFIIEEIYELSTGVGKKRVEQVILTHEHFDHAGGLMKIKKEFNPHIISFSKLPGVDEIAYNNMKIKIGDKNAEIIHTPGHSNDSICIYIPDEKVLFSGDTPLNIKTPGGSYSKDYVAILEQIVTLEIDTIYSGHDNPYTNNVRDLLASTLYNVRQSKII